MSFERWLLIVRLRLRSLLLRPRVEEELSEELGAHIERKAAQLRAAGLSPADARSEAQRQFGSLLRAREYSRDVWGWRWLDELLLDVRFALRTLIKSPVFSITAIGTLALATGATTAIFSVVNSVVLRPLPFSSPERLVQVTELMPIGGAGAVIPQDIEEFRRQSTSFEEFAGYGLTTRHLATASGSERLTAVVAEGTFFSVLGVRPIAGRTFEAGDRGQLAVISDRVWDRRFNRDPAAIGQQLPLDGNVFDPKLGRSIIERQPFTVVGVMPPRFQFPYAAGSIYLSALPESHTDLWLFDDRERRGGRLDVTARLKPGISLAAAEAELNFIEQRIDEASSNPYRPTGVEVTPLRDVVLGSIAQSLWLLFGAVGLVLAAACANVANLLLARTTGRMREVGTRMALGAGRSRVVRQLLTESLVLSFAGGVAGVVVAWWGSRLLVTLGAARIPRSHEITLDWTVFAFLLLVSVATALLFGLTPAIGAARADPGSLSGRSPGHASTGRGLGRVRDALIVVEVGLAFVLGFGAASVLRELNRLQSVESGMATANVLTMHLSPRVTDAEYFRIEEDVAKLPGVEAAGLIHMVPLQNWGGIGTFQIRGRPPDDISRMPTAELRSVTPGYFSVLGVPIKAGRGLVERDGSSEPLGLVINETLARIYFASADPIGAELDRGTIVGVAGDVRGAHLDRPALPRIYSAVNPNSGIAPDIGMSLLVRTRGAPETLIESVRRAVHQVNPALATFNVRTMDQVVADSLWELNLYRWLIGLFAALALALAALGLYGVISYSVSSRSREFAVRLAVGSSPMRLARGVLGRGLVVTSAGLVAGVAGVLIAVRATPASGAFAAPHLPTIAALGGLVMAVAVGSCLAPALRVAAVEPASTLRHD